MTAPINMREVVERALDEATVRAAQDLAEVRRRLEGGEPWSSATMAVVRDRYARRKRDIAIAKAILAELDPEMR